jgi:hypothetical protein
MKLNQVIAIEKGIKSRVCAKISDLYKIIQKPDFFNGFYKAYLRKDEEGEDFPSENKKVIYKTDELLKEFLEAQKEVLNVTFTKDTSNCYAFANIEVDGEVLLEKVPASFLIYLEKEFTNMRTFIGAMPVLEESEDWLKDDNSGLYKTMATKTHKTKKVQRPIVLYEATKEHVAQTQLISEDVVVGYWDTIKQSGAMPVPMKKKLLANIDTLLKSIKIAREQANNTDIQNLEIGNKLFDYLLK